MTQSIRLIDSHLGISKSKAMKITMALKTLKRVSPQGALEITVPTQTARQSTASNPIRAVIKGIPRWPRQEKPKQTKIRMQFKIILNGKSQKTIKNRELDL